jgi:hypothetical protein
MPPKGKPRPASKTQYPNIKMPEREVVTQPGEVFDPTHLNAELFGPEEEDKQSEAVERPAASQPPRKEEPEEGLQMRSAVELLFSLPNAPKQAEIGQWKSMWADVYVTPFTEDRAYVWRWLRRKEWIDFLNDQVVAQNSRILQERVISRCLLWPPMTDVFFTTCPAGLIDTLYEAIMRASLFLEADTALAVTEKL